MKNRFKKKRALYLFIISIAAISLFSVNGILADNKGGKEMLKGIEWLGHASFKLESEGKVVYVDPWNVKSADAADVICITHPHYDHLSVKDVNKLHKDNTVIIVPLDSKKGLPGLVKAVKPGDKVEANGIKVEAVPAYNINKQFHPKSSGWLGYVITLPDGRRFYHAGDTDLIPEMKDIKTDIAALPIGGTYTMNAQEAAQAAALIRPKVAIPMHWGTIVGNRNDVEVFKKNCQVEVAVLEQR